MADEGLLTVTKTVMHYLKNYFVLPCVHGHRQRPEVDIRCCSQSLFNLFLRQNLTELGTFWLARMTGTSPGDVSVSTPSVWKLQVCATVPCFSHGCWGSQTQVLILEHPKEPSLQHSDRFIWSRQFSELSMSHTGKMSTSHQTFSTGTGISMKSSKTSCSQCSEFYGYIQSHLFCVQLQTTPFMILDPIPG